MLSVELSMVLRLYALYQKNPYGNSLHAKVNVYR